MSKAEANTKSSNTKDNNMKFTITMWDGTDFTNNAEFETKTPSARQILDDFGLIPPDEHILLHAEDGGKLNEIGLDEEFELEKGKAAKFIAFHSDRTFKFSLNERRMPWGESEISVAALKTITGTADDQEFVLERKDKRDKGLSDSDMVALDESGLERIYTRGREWKLKVQDVVLTILTPTIIVKDALVQAGIDPTTGWTAAIKYKDAPREAITLDGVIDLTRKGIEKLWLRPDHIRNGEANQSVLRAFPLREKDEDYLSKSDLKIETIVEGGRRWAILRQVPLPQGYTVGTADIAIEVPPTYPAAQLDMFYCHPHLARKTGDAIPQTQTSQSIERKSYQRWSRHREGTTAWNPANDSIITHIAIITDAIAKEVDQ